MSYSPYIYQLARILRGFGWRVSLYAQLVNSHGVRYSGRCRHEQREIETGCSSARETLLVLVHEAGHALAATRGGDAYHALPELRREQLAYLYGWAVLHTLKIPVTRAEWRDHHNDLLGESDGRQATPTVA